MTCENCNEDSLEKFGFMPLRSVEEEHDGDAWVNTQVCTNCGVLSITSVSESDLRRADERYLYTLVQYDVLTRHEAKEVLDLV